jgi:hypothetical protein
LKLAKISVLIPQPFRFGGLWSMAG